MKHKRKLDQLAAVVTSLLFTLTSLGLQAPLNAGPDSPQPHALALSGLTPEVCVLDDAWYAPLARGKALGHFPLVVLLQEAHANYGIQKSIVTALEHFQARFKALGLPENITLGLEGNPPREIDPHFFRSFPDPRLRRIVMDDFMRSGEIDGAEFYAINVNPKARLFGIDDPALYESNLARFRQFTPRREVCLASLAELSLGFERLARKIYSGPIQDLRKSRLRLGRDEDKRSFILHLELLRGLARYKRISLAAYPALEAAMDRKPPKSREFLNEMEALEETLLEKLPRSRDEKVLLACESSLELLRKLASFSLTKKEFEKIRKSRILTDKKMWQSLDEIARLEGIPLKSQDTAKKFARELRPAYEFFETASKRDRALAGNLAKLIRSSKPKIVFAVLGGFHQEGVSRELRARGISYLALLPETKDPGDSSRYWRLLGEDRSTAKLRSRVPNPNFRLEAWRAYVRAASLGSEREEFSKYTTGVSQALLQWTGGKVHEGDHMPDDVLLAKEFDFLRRQQPADLPQLTIAQRSPIEARMGGRIFRLVLVRSVKDAQGRDHWYPKLLGRKPVPLKVSKHKIGEERYALVILEENEVAQTGEAGSSDLPVGASDDLTTIAQTGANPAVAPPAAAPAVPEPEKKKPPRVSPRKRSLRPEISLGSVLVEKARQLLGYVRARRALKIGIPVSAGVAAGVIGLVAFLRGGRPETAPRPDQTNVATSSEVSPSGEAVGGTETSEAQMIAQIRRTLAVFDTAAASEHWELARSILTKAKDNLLSLRMVPADLLREIGIREELLARAAETPATVPAGPEIAEVPQPEPPEPEDTPMGQPPRDEPRPPEPGIRPPPQPVNPPRQGGTPQAPALSRAEEDRFHNQLWEEALTPFNTALLDGNHQEAARLLVQAEGLMRDHRSRCGARTHDDGVHMEDYPKLFAAITGQAHTAFRPQQENERRSPREREPRTALEREGRVRVIELVVDLRYLLIKFDQHYLWLDYTGAKRVLEQAEEMARSIPVVPEVMREELARKRRLIDADMVTIERTRAERRARILEEERAGNGSSATREEILSWCRDRISRVERNLSDSNLPIARIHFAFLQWFVDSLPTVPSELRAQVQALESRLSQAERDSRTRQEGMSQWDQDGTNVTCREKLRVAEEALRAGNYQRALIYLVDTEERMGRLPRRALRNVADVVIRIQQMKHLIAVYWESQEGRSEPGAGQTPAPELAQEEQDRIVSRVRELISQVTDTLRQGNPAGARQLLDEARREASRLPSLPGAVRSGLERAENRVGEAQLEALARQPGGYDEYAEAGVRSLSRDEMNQIILVDIQRIIQEADSYLARSTRENNYTYASREALRRAETLLESLPQGLAQVRDLRGRIEGLRQRIDNFNLRGAGGRSLGKQGERILSSLVSAPFTPLFIEITRENSGVVAQLTSPGKDPRRGNKAPVICLVQDEGLRRRLITQYGSQDRLWRRSRVGFLSWNQAMSEMTVEDAKRLAKKSMIFLRQLFSDSRPELRVEEAVFLNHAFPNLSWGPEVLRVRYDGRRFARDPRYRSAYLTAAFYAAHHRDELADLFHVKTDTGTLELRPTVLDQLMKAWEAMSSQRSLAASA